MEVYVCFYRTTELFISNAMLLGNINSNNFNLPLNKKKSPFSYFSGKKYPHQWYKGDDPFFLQDLSLLSFLYEILTSHPIEYTHLLMISDKTNAITTCDQLILVFNRISDTKKVQFSYDFRKHIISCVLKAQKYFYYTGSSYCNI